MSFDIANNVRHHGFKRLLLAVSGGLDSICLAHYFIANREALGIEWLGIAHVHHGLREVTADRDAKFVEAFAGKHNVPFFLKKLDGDALKNAEGSLEENARDARYKALVDIALDPSASPQDDAPRISYPTSSIINHPSSIIVTAHHAGDQAETMYMRLRRGTTLEGLRGIQEVRALSKEPSAMSYEGKGASPLVSIYRPFLNITREELLAYARENSLEWCEDESNEDVKFARNFTRHEALPHLEETCPGATRQLCRIAGLADRAYAKVIARCEEVFGNTILDGGSVSAMTHQNKPTMALTLDKKKLNKVLLEHADTDLSEMFRLWLSAKGFRFPIGFFFAQEEPANVKIPHRSAYRRRSVVKNGPTVKICEFSTPEEAQKFVSCREKDKGL